MSFSVPAAVSADSNNIQIQLPASGDRDWGTNLRDLAWVLLANHDHGTAGGQPISGTSLSADSVTGAKILLDNAQYLRWKNSSAVATNVIRLASDDKIEVAVDVDLLIMSNNVALQGDESGGTARSMIKVTSSNALEVSDSNLGQIMRMQKETLADNVSATDVPDFAVLGTDESAFIFYSMDRGTDNQMGMLWIDEDNTHIIEDFAGDALGVTFTNVSGQLKYATTSTGTAVIAKFFVVRG